MLTFALKQPHTNIVCYWELYLQLSLIHVVPDDKLKALNPNIVVGFTTTFKYVVKMLVGWQKETWSGLLSKPSNKVKFVKVSTWCAVKSRMINVSIPGFIRFIIRLYKVCNLHDWEIALLNWWNDSSPKDAIVNSVIMVHYNEGQIRARLWPKLSALGHQLGTTWS